MTMTTEKAKENKDVFVSEVLDAADGSGDAVITLPDELLEMHGWQEGDELEMNIEDGKIVLTKK